MFFDNSYYIKCLLCYSPCLCKIRAKDIDTAWFDEGENIRVADAFVVDIMLNACGQTYETLKRYAETIDLDGLPVRTLSLEGLLLTKQTMRDKDVSDRVILERALEIYRKNAELTPSTTK